MGTAIADVAAATVQGHHLSIQKFISTVSTKFYNHLSTPERFPGPGVEVGKMDTQVVV